MEYLLKSTVSNLPFAIQNYNTQNDYVSVLEEFVKSFRKNAKYTIFSSIINSVADWVFN